MITYLRIGIFVAIMATIEAHIDPKLRDLRHSAMQEYYSEYGRTITHLGFVICEALSTIMVATIWPYQVYYWIKTLVTCNNT